MKALSDSFGGDKNRSGCFARKTLGWSALQRGHTAMTGAAPGMDRRLLSFIFCNKLCCNVHWVVKKQVHTKPVYLIYLYKDSVLFVQIPPIYRSILNLF